VDKTKRMNVLIPYMEGTSWKYRLLQALHVSVFGTDCRKHSGWFQKVGRVDPHYNGLVGAKAGHGSRAVACFLFARLEAGTVGSNPTQGMDV
jgi:hypothetical protein